MEVPKKFKSVVSSTLGGPLHKSGFCHKDSFLDFARMKVDFKNGGGFYEFKNSSPNLMGGKLILMYSGKDGFTDLR